MGTAFETGVPLDPATCAAYWPMSGLNAAGKVADISGRGNDLSVVGIDSSNFIELPAKEDQWVGFAFDDPVAPTLFTGDHRHSLSTGATVKVMRGDWYGASSVEEGSTTVVAEQPFVIELGSVPTADEQWWWKIDDPSNPNDYIELPSVWLGSKSELTRSYSRQHSAGEVGIGKLEPTPSGGMSGWLTADEMEVLNGRFTLQGSDVETLRSVYAEARRGRPVLWSPDGTAASARLVHVRGALDRLHQHIGNGWHHIDVDLVEVGAGIGS